MHDFEDKLKEYRCKHDNILILGDLNETVNGREKSNQRICDIGFINVFQYILREKLPPTTMNGGKGIDYAWATSQIIPIIKKY